MKYSAGKKCCKMLMGDRISVDCNPGEIRMKIQNIELITSIQGLWQIEIKEVTCDIFQFNIPHN